MVPRPCFCQDAHRNSVAESDDTRLTKYWNHPRGVIFSERWISGLKLAQLDNEADFMLSPDLVRTAIARLSLTPHSRLAKRFSLDTDYVFASHFGANSRNDRGKPTCSSKTAHRQTAEATFQSFVSIITEAVDRPSSDRRMTHLQG